MTQKRLSRRLGPRAKRLLLTAGDQQVASIVNLAPSVSSEQLKQDVDRCGGTIRSWLPEAHLATIDIPASRLSELAEIKGVIQVEAGEQYRD